VAADPRRGPGAAGPEVLIIARCARPDCMEVERAD
jgi:hypothetical protein